MKIEKIPDSEEYDETMFRIHSFKEIEAETIRAAYNERLVQEALEADDDGVEENILSQTTDIVLALSKISSEEKTSLNRTSMQSMVTILKIFHHETTSSAKNIARTSAMHSYRNGSVSERIKLGKTAGAIVELIGSRVMDIDMCFEEEGTNLPDMQQLPQRT